MQKVEFHSSCRLNNVLANPICVWIKENREKYGKKYQYIKKLWTRLVSNIKLSQIQRHNTYATENISEHWKWIKAYRYFLWNEYNIYLSSVNTAHKRKIAVQYY